MKEGKIKRKRVDIENETFLTSSIDNTNSPQQDRCVTKVKVPYYFSVSIRVQVGIDNDGKPIYATTDHIHKKPFPKEWVIEETKEVTLQFTNKCPKCATTGSPRIDKKNTDDYHFRPTTNTKKNTSKQEQQYRLIYNHKQEDGKIKQCVIAKFDKQGIFTETGRVSQRVRDYIFPNYIIKNI